MQIRRFAATTLMALAASFAVAAASAHHGYSDFDVCRNVAVRGSVESVSWVSPHVILTLRDAEAVVHSVVWFSPIQGARAQINEKTLRVGDEVIVTGAPHRDPQKHLMSVVARVERPSDGWLFVNELRTASSSCGAAARAP